MRTTKTRTTPAPVLISIADAAIMLGLSVNGVTQLCDATRLDARYSGRRRLVVVQSVHDYIASLPAFKD